MRDPSQAVRRQIDVVQFLAAVVQENTKAYRQDFKYDVATLRRAARESNAAERTFYWMSRPYGTWCLKEREVFLRGTGAFSTWTHYKEDAAGIRAYRVAVTGLREEAVMGDVYPLHYEEQVRRVLENALPVHLVTASFEDGSMITMDYGEFSRDKAALAFRHGRILELHYFPESEAELTRTLTLEHRLQLGKGQKAKTAASRNPVR